MSSKRMIWLITLSNLFRLCFDFLHTYLCLNTKFHWNFVCAILVPLPCTSKLFQGTATFVQNGKRLFFDNFCALFELCIYRTWIVKPICRKWIWVTEGEISSQKTHVTHNNISWLRSLLIQNENKLNWRLVDWVQFRSCFYLVSFRYIIVQTYQVRYQKEPIIVCTTHVCAITKHIFSCNIQ